MKSNKKQITCRRYRDYTVVWSLSFGFGSRLAMFVVLGFSGKIKYKFWVEKPYLNVFKKYYFFSAQTAIYGHTSCKPVLNSVKPVTPGLRNFQKIEKTVEKRLFLFRLNAN